MKFPERTGTQSATCPQNMGLPPIWDTCHLVGYLKLARFARIVSGLPNRTPFSANRASGAKIAKRSLSRFARSSHVTKLGVFLRTDSHEPIRANRPDSHCGSPGHLSHLPSPSIFIDINVWGSPILWSPDDSLRIKSNALRLDFREGHLTLAFPKAVHVCSEDSQQKMWLYVARFCTHQTPPQLGNTPLGVGMYWRGGAYEIPAAGGQNISPPLSKMPPGQKWRGPEEGFF